MLSWCRLCQDCEGRINALDERLREVQLNISTLERRDNELREEKKRLLEQKGKKRQLEQKIATKQDRYQCPPPPYSCS